MLRTLAAMTVAGAALAAPPSATAAGPAPTLDALAGVNFASTCRFSHRAADDPIVFPGQPGRSHEHTFVGNTGTNAFSTLASLLRGRSTCSREGERSAYWVPTLVRRGRAVEPLGATIYYRRRTLAPVQPFPPGLRMIAGDAHATTPQLPRVASWGCGAVAELRHSPTVPLCPPGLRTSLRLHVRFPDCWDGRSLDSADHQRHMAYSLRGACPQTHPVAVPAIALIFRYPIRGGRDVELASGGAFSAHADFVNAWRQETLAGLVERCLNALRHCGRGD